MQVTLKSYRLMEVNWNKSCALLLLNVLNFVMQESKTYEHCGSLRANVTCCTKAGLTKTWNQNRNWQIITCKLYTIAIISTISQLYPCSCSAVHPCNTKGSQFHTNTECVTYRQPPQVAKALTSSVPYVPYRHQYAYPPYCSLWIPHGTYKENVTVKSFLNWLLFLLFSLYCWEKLDAYHS